MEVETSAKPHVSAGAVALPEQQREVPLWKQSGDVHEGRQREEDVESAAHLRVANGREEDADVAEDAQAGEGHHEESGRDDAVAARELVERELNGRFLVKSYWRDCDACPFERLGVLSLRVFRIFATML